MRFGQFAALSMPLWTALNRLEQLEIVPAATREVILWKYTFTYAHHTSRMVYARMEVHCKFRICRLISNFAAGEERTALIKSSN